MTRALFTDLCASLLAEGRAVRFRASGASMAPAVCEGDLLTVVARPAAALQPGDIALYRAGRGVVAHRVVSQVPGGVLCRGDAPSCVPEQVGEADVLGLVIAVHRPRWRRWAARCRRIGARLRCLVPRSLAPRRGREKVGS